MDQKPYVVTGANAGIGKAIAQALAGMGRRVVMVSRDPVKGKAAADEVRAASKNEAVELVVGSLNTVADAKKLAETIRGRYPAIGCLINNAGVWMTKKVLNADGIETTFMVNHLGPFILTNLLLPNLMAGKPARVVNVNAGLYVFGRLDLERTPTGKDFGRFRTYCNTKQANLLFTVELARRLSAKDVTVNALHPGVIKTGLATGDARGVLGAAIMLWKYFMKTPEEGAAAPVWVATAPELKGVTGRFFQLTKEQRILPKGKDPETAARLWELSTKLTGVGGNGHSRRNET
jgi:NAD(P)-dependent dehydrogenase (short-subunit alcohol dehydrogenase family)